jgi:8-oxo-dGTP pyrophosphatase MutT (NUDIX family)
MPDIKNNYYRTSVKALILDDRKRFLLTRESDGRWELPGGGIDHGETPEMCLKREINEEMGIEVISVSKQPSYFYTDNHWKYEWIANVLFETTLAHLDFIPSDECTEIRFFTKEEALKEELFPNVKVFLSLFDPSNHLATSQSSCRTVT